jgi:GNAT superfamily N-acetyltransferase
MKIRFGTIEDLSEVQRLNQALFVHERDHVVTYKMANVDWPYQAAGIGYFTECLKGERNQAVFIAEYSGKIVGYLASYCRSFAYLKDNPLAEIDSMFVEEAYRGKGVGTKLVDEFKKWATSLGAKHLQVMGYAQNHTALDFYRQNGFEDFAIRLIMPVKLP